MKWVIDSFKDHKRIFFEGNGYSSKWEKIAEKRGLPHFRTTPDALPALIAPENIAFFETYGVLSENEAQARYVAKAEQYAKVLNIEAKTMSYMTRHMYLPALFKYSGKVAESVARKQEIGITSQAELDVTRKLTEGIDGIYAAAGELEAKNGHAATLRSKPQTQCEFYRDEVIPAMEQLRKIVDEMELICGHDFWPVPSYNEMLFYV